MLSSMASIFAVALVAYGYYKYFRQIYAGKTIPHRFSWLIWALATTLVAGLQFAGGAGFTGWIITAITAALCWWVYLESLLRPVVVPTTWVDRLCLALAILAMIAWWGANAPMVSIILLTSIDIIGFIPTIRKTWLMPFSEPLSFYSIGIVRFLFALLALQVFTVQTALYPLALLAANVVIYVLIIHRRDKVSDGTSDDE